MDYGRAVSLKISTSQRTKNSVQNKKNDWFGEKNRVNLSNIKETILLKFPEKFDQPFSPVFTLGNMFPESHVFVGVSVTR